MHYPILLLSHPSNNSIPSASAVVALFCHPLEFCATIQLLQAREKIDTKCAKEEKTQKIAAEKCISLIILFWLCLGRILMDVSNFMAIKINLKMRKKRERAEMRLVYPISPLSSSIHVHCLSPTRKKKKTSLI